VSDSVIRAIKQSVSDQVTSQAYFANIPVLIKVSTEIQSGILAGTYPAGGLAILIGGFSARNPNPNTPGPYFDDARLMVDVLEQVTINQSKGGPDVDEVGETAMRLLHQFAPMGANEAAWVSDWSEVDDKQYNLRRFYLQMPAGFAPLVLPDMPAIVAAPAPGAGLQYPLNVTLALAQPVPGAAIFYTLDGSFPGPFTNLYEPYSPLTDSNGEPLTDSQGNYLMTGGSVLIPSAGTTLRARAYLQGRNSGQPTTFTFN
jgi:hypothetical protein